MTSGTVRLLRDLRAELDAAGLTGWFLVRDLDSGEEIGIDPDALVPLASLVKVPLAAAVLDRVASGELSEGRQLRLAGRGSREIGPAGLTRFRFPATIALADVVYLSTCLSDNVAADALFDLVSPAHVTHYVRGLGITDLTLRHRLSDLTETPAEALVQTPQLAQTLAAHGGTPSGGHRVRQLDSARANSGTARACVDLLEVLWTTPGPVVPEVSARVRELMGQHVVARQRLWPDFASDATTWSSKTGTLLNHRHEIGVVEHADGDRYAVAALTASRVSAGIQHVAEATMARVARRLRDHLRH
ncbi:serine hydrolase [Nocardioides pantholopis]|uniref:serine hydrolase n=1 Tax=Nocardioides pantholopis TaxID=2483798 RepID=UPI001F495604|nr:serine hydrolase [Nocardioides pantholopis]